MKSLNALLIPLLLLLSPGLRAEEPRERSEIGDEYKWDLSSMYASDEAWEADAARFDARLPDLDAFRGRLGESGDTLLAAITTMESIESLAANLYVFAGLSSFEDMRVGAKSARYSRARGLLARYNEATAFFRPELLVIPPAQLTAMVDDTPGLAIYRHYIDEQLRLRDYTLGEQEEKILAAASDPLGRFSRIFGAFDNADIRFGIWA